MLRREVNQALLRAKAVIEQEAREPHGPRSS
jgi:hypothetical protein